MRSGGCITGVPGCIILASSGGIALASLIVDNMTIPLVYAVILLSLGLTVYKLTRFSDAMIVMTSATILIAISLLAPRTLAGFILFYLTMAWLILRTTSPEVLLSYWPLVVIPAYAYGGQEWIRIFSASVILLSSIVAYLESGRGHALMITAVSPIAALVSPEISLAASASSLALAGVLAGIVERSGCPFTKDSGLVFIGVSLSIIGVLMGIIEGPWKEYWTIIWLIGFLYIEAGALVPQGIFHRPSSLAAEA